MRRFLRGVFGIVIGGPLLVLVLCFFLGPPLMVLLETIDLLRMQEEAQGTVNAVSLERGSKGTSRATISYRFDVGGRQVKSDRYVPGYWGNSGTYSGGAGIAKDFPIGQRVTVYYSRRNPELCALEYGWFCWPAALTLIWFGFALFLIGAASSKSGFGMACIRNAGWGFIVYAFGLLFLGPVVVRVRDLHWHLLAWATSVAVVIVYGYLQRRTAPKGSVSATDDEAARESTASLVFGFVFVSGWTLAATVPGIWMLFGNGIPRINFAALLLIAVIACFAWSGLRTLWSVGQELYRRYQAH